MCTLYPAHFVCTLYPIHFVYTLYPVNFVCTLYLIHFVRILYTIHFVCTLYDVHFVCTLYLSYFVSTPYPVSSSPYYQVSACDSGTMVTIATLYKDQYNMQIVKFPKLPHFHTDCIWKIKLCIQYFL